MDKSKKAIILFSWFGVSNALTLALLVVLLTSTRQSSDIKYSLFDSKPHISPHLEDTLTGEDSRAQTIDQYFAAYKCPLTGTGKKMVELADKYGFEFWWLAAIAWQESTCGKQMIPGSNNAWGYGIYGDTVTKFSSWDEAMDKIAWDLSKNFFGKGLNEPCEVEKRYTPPSKGSWCKSIKYFRDEMLDFKSK